MSAELRMDRSGARHLARRRVRRLRRRPAALGASSRRRPAARCSSSAAGTGRVALDLARAGHRRDRRSTTRASCSRSSIGAAPPPGSRSRPSRRTLGRSSSDTVRRGARADAAPAPARRRLGERGAVLDRVAAHLEPGGIFAAALLADQPALGPVRDRQLAPRRARARRLDLLEPAARRRGDRDARSRSPRVRQLVSPRGDLREEPTSTRLDRLAPEDLEHEARCARPAARRAHRGPAHRRPRRLGRLRPGGGLMELRLLALYPEQMNIYADRGNILFLRRRCEWRGIGFSYAAAGPGERFDPAGPRPDLHRRRPGPRPAARRRRHARDQARGARRGGRRRRRRARASAAATSCSATATSSATSGSPGLGLADLETVREPGPRLIGNVAIEVDLGDGPEVIAGFENHGGRTRLGPGATPLGRVIERPRQQRRRRATRASAARNLIGTYMHGPLLPKNAAARRPPDQPRARPPRRLGARARAARRRARARRAPQRAGGRDGSSTALERPVEGPVADPDSIPRQQPGAIPGLEVTGGERDRFGAAAEVASVEAHQVRQLDPPPLAVEHRLGSDVGARRRLQVAIERQRPHTARSAGTRRRRSRARSGSAGRAVRAPHSRAGRPCAAPCSACTAIGRCGAGPRARSRRASSRARRRGASRS